MFTSLSEVQQATRDELVQYLESWGTACYDDESTSLLREAAIETFQTEGCQMKDKQNRWPEVGDLLIHTDGAAFNSGEKCQGLITEVVGDVFQSRVFVQWADNNAPYDYGDKYGYSAVNIHNCFDTFELVKA